MQGGFTFWWISSLDPQPSANAVESVVKDLKLWHIYNKTVYAYPSQKGTFDGLKIRATSARSAERRQRCVLADILPRDRHPQFGHSRMEDGITAPESGFGPEANLTVENSYLRNWTNVNVPTAASVNGCG